MRSTSEDLLRQILLGEDSYLELKEVFFSGGKVKAPQGKDLADGLAAFANSRGGVLVLGVRDGSREVVGIARDDVGAVVTHVRNVVLDLVQPPLDVDLELLELPDARGTMRCVVRVAVEQSIFVHQSPRGYFRRVGDSKKKMPPDVLLRLQQDRSLIGATRFDEQAVASASLADLDTDVVERFRTTRVKDDVETLAVKLGMARRRSDGDVRPTVAGILFAGSESTRDLMPNAFVQAVAYRGVSAGGVDGGANYQLDAQDIGGPLDVQVADACRFVARNQRVAAEKTIGRHDIPQYDLGAVFEGVVNAVAHRDYSIYGSKIRLQMFSDRLELYSPGALPNTVTVDTLEFRQFSRNATIANLFARCPVPTGIPGLTTSRTTLMERRGEGVGFLLERSEKHSGKTPEYALFNDSELRLTIYGADAATPSD